MAFFILHELYDTRLLKISYRFNNIYGRGRFIHFKHSNENVQANTCLRFRRSDGIAIELFGGKE